MKKYILLTLISLVFCFTYATNYVVTNTNDTGNGSLRTAITNCLNNAGSAPHTIQFQIPTTDQGYNSSTGVWTITYTDEGLPPITTGYITIDGTTQTTFAGNTNPNGPEIELNGSVRTVEVCFSILNSSNNTIKGLIINEFLYGIQIYGKGSFNNKVTGCYIGCNYNGTARKGNVNAIEIISGANNNQIGDIGSANWNLISGNEYAGIRMSDSEHNLIINNWVGVDRTGSIALKNYDGITVEGAAAYNQIGGISPSGELTAKNDSGNVAAGNVAYGVDIFGVGCIWNKVQGNLIGTDAAGTIAIPNTYGLLCDDRSNHNIVGGYLNGQGNLISGNTAFGAYFYNNSTSYMYLIGNKIGTDLTGTYAIPNETGVHIDGASYANVVDSNLISGNKANGITLFGIYSDYNTIIRNKIGTDITGNLPLGNGVQGILITQNAANNTIGGSAAYANIIAYNGRNGIKIESSLAKNNLISCNSIYDNANYSIEIFPNDGFNENDEGDVDDGPNGMMNSPVINNISYNSGQATISGNIDVASPTNTRIEIYKSKINDYFSAECIEYIGVTTCDVNGNWAYIFNYDNVDDYYVALAIDASNNTSELSLEYPEQVITYNLDYNTVGSPANGTITATVDYLTVLPSSTVQAQKNVMFTATPDSSYIVKEWTVNGEIVLGNKTNYYMITGMDTNYTVTVEFKINDVGIEEAISNSDIIKLYPNPCKKGSILNISSDKTPDYIIVYDSHGKEILKTKNCKALNTNDLETGLYFLMEVNSSGITTKKFIVN